MLRRFLILLVLILALPLAAPAQDTAGAGDDLAELAGDDTDDKGFLTRFLQNKLSSAGRTVDIQGFEGALSSRATFRSITIADERGTWLRLEDGAIHWTRSALLLGRVEIQELSAKRIEIPRAPHSEAEDQPSNTEARSFGLPELPVGINIEKIDAQSVFLGKDLLGEDATVTLTGAMSLADGGGAADIAINRIDGKKGDFTFDGSFDKETRVLNIDLSLDEDPEGIFSRMAGIEGNPAVTADIHGEGPLSGYRADVRIATDGVPRVTGQIAFAAAEGADGTAGNRFDVQIGGDLASLLPPDSGAFFGNDTKLAATGWRAATGRLELESLSLDTDALKIDGSLATNDQNAPQMLDLVVDFGQQAGATTLPVTIPFVEPPVTVQSGNLAIGYDASQGSDWSLKGWLTEIHRQGTVLQRLELDGAGAVVLADGDSLQRIDGTISFDASGLALGDPKIQRVVGENITGQTGFDFTPGKVLELSDMQISGKDYTLDGQLTLDGLSSGLVVSTTDVIASHANLANLSELAGRNLSGSASAALTGYYQLLSGAFDVEGTLTGTDLTVDSEQLDHLLRGNSTIALSAGRTESGTELRSLSLNAQKISLTATGSAANRNVDLVADFNVPTLADIDPQLAGMLNAKARLVGGPGARQLTVTGAASGLQTGNGAIDGVFAGETLLDVEFQERSEGFTLTSLQLQNPQLDLSGSGSARGGVIDAGFDIALKDFGALGEGFGGTLTARADISGDKAERRFVLTGTGRELSVGQENLDGLLRGDTRITLQATQQGKVITLGDTRLATDQFTATATGTLGAAGTSADIRLDVPSLGPMGGGWHGVFNADAVISQGDDGIRKMRLDAIGQDLALGQTTVDGALSGRTDITMLAEQTPDGVLKLDSLDISNPQLAAQASGMLIEGRVSGQAAAQIANLAALGRGWSGSLDGTAQLTTDGSGTRQIEIIGTGENIRLGQAQTDAALTGTTTVDIAAEQHSDGTIRIGRASISNDQLSAVAQGEIGDGHTDATGKLSVRDLASLGLGLQGALNVDAAFAGAGKGTRRLTVTGTGKDLALGQSGNAGKLSGTTDIDFAALELNGTYTIERANLTNDQTRLSAAGSFGPTGTDASASLNVTDLSAIGLGVAGAMNAEASLKDDESGSLAFALTGTATDLALRQAGADRALRGEAQFSAKGSVGNGLVTLESARIDNPRLRATAAGTYGTGKTNLNAQIQASDLSFLGGGIGGAVDATATVRDGDGGRRFDVTGTAQDLRIGNAQADGAMAGATSFAANGTQSGSVIQLDDVRVSNRQIEAHAAGTYGGGRTDLDAELSMGQLGFAGIDGNLRATAKIEDSAGGRRITAQAVANGLGIGNDRIDGLLRGQTTADIALLQGSRGLTIERLIARNPQLQVNVDGDPVQGLDVDARIVDLAPLLPGISGPAQALGTVRQSDGRTQIDIAVTAPGGTRAQIAGIYAGEATDLRMAGVSDAAVANPFLRTRSIEGPISFDLRMQGAPALESISGTVNMASGRLAEPKIGLSIDDLRLDARLNQGLIDVDIAGSLGTGRGSLAVDGTIDLRSGAPVLDLAATLDQATLRDPNLYELTADGTVSITGVASDGPLVSGTITIIQAEFRIPSTGLGGVQAIPEITHVNDDWRAAATRAKAGLEAYGSLAAQAADLSGPAATPPANPARFDLTINAPNQVFVRGRGVDAELGGELQIAGSARTPIPIGHLSLIRGRVDLLGKRFDLAEGLVELQGSLIPVIRLVARHVEDDITIRIIIDGEVSDPDITFESDPSLPEEEVMSYLLFGQGLDQLSPLQAAQLANALAILAGAGGIGVIGNIREAAGLDDLDMTIDDDGSVAVRAGKYLTRNVYTDVELSDSGQTQINLNLDMTDALTARGSVDSEGDSLLGLYFETDY